MCLYAVDIVKTKEEFDHLFIYMNIYTYQLLTEQHF